MESFFASWLPIEEIETTATRQMSSGHPAAPSLLPKATAPTALYPGSQRLCAYVVFQDKKNFFGCENIFF